MNPGTDFGIQAQINTLHCLKYVCSINDFETTKHGDVTTPFKLAEDAFWKETKFMRSIESETWPAGIEHLKISQPMTSMKDDTITNNRKNELTVLEYHRMTTKQLNLDFIFIRNSFWSEQTAVFNWLTNPSECGKKGGDANMNTATTAPGINPGTQTCFENGGRSGPSPCKVENARLV